MESFFLWPFSVICTMINHSLHFLYIISESWECLIKPTSVWSKYWPLRRLIVKFINIYRLSSTVLSTKIVCSYSPNKWEISWIAMSFQYALVDIKICAKYNLNIWKLNWKISSEFHNINYINSMIVIKKSTRCNKFCSQEFL